jgi:hypothetical protein
LGSLKELEIRYRAPLEEGETEEEGVEYLPLLNFPAEVEDQKGKVKEYVNHVESLLGKRRKEEEEKRFGHRRNRALVGRLEIAEEGDSDDEKPEWTKEDNWLGEPYFHIFPPCDVESLKPVRIHAMLASSLASDLAPLLPAPSCSERELLLALSYVRILCITTLTHIVCSFPDISDGHLLCQAYNALVRTSPKPFGFIPAKSIHELPQSQSLAVAGGDVTREGKEKKAVGATFRRTENLTVWAALS